MIGLYILVILVVVALWLVALYNGLVKMNNRTKEAWSDIDVQLKRRHDLIPNLVNSVKGYMTHEKDLLENITKARAGAMSAQEAGNTAELARTEGLLGGMLGKLQIAMEAYPDLKANQNVGQLMDELSDTENKIQASRRFYNGMVRDFNTKMETFPNNVFAGMLKFTKYNFFEIEDATERQNVEVKL
ncbi:MAG: LemA family protein [Candidatus Magasanikbacteria bacterium GW2011_GWC2_37_14]|uniref:LemA family protein n=1 Tax=Candidatus Magasanikbacteria bacterium GW2011_GWC2_37_14 TaxID=1619046 RepID=A0A0G0IST3_9BACT|nr:MAG: LemA family protein [Candidatus Magasanikbacteria bacterium GW2011_GWC2_37_14]